MTIKVLENFKNNKIHDTITVWCSDGNSLRYEKADLYLDGDTLLLLITYCDLEGNEGNGTMPDTLEKADDYMPIHCSISILLYQQDSIYGNYDSLSVESKIEYLTFFKQLGINSLVNTNKFKDVYFIQSNNEVNIIIKNAFSSEVYVDIYNIEGKIVKKFTMEKNSKTIQFPIDNLHSGIYIINVFMKNDFIFHSKLMKI